nr:hypothetical protein [Achromobacter ruhlandii]
MQTFKDTETGQFWQFEDDVIADNSSGTYLFYQAVAPQMPDGADSDAENPSAPARGAQLNLPPTLEPANIEDMPAPDPAANPPQAVTRYQLREAMRLTPWPQDDRPDWTLFDAFDELMKEPTTPAYYRRAWDELVEFEVESATIRAAADALGMTQGQRLDLFELAAALRA